MDKLGKWWQAHKPTRRRVIQLYAALLYNAHLTGFAEGKIYTGALKNLCLPGLNCYSCPGAAFACPLGALQNALASSGTRTPSYVLGILLLFGLLLGRTVCGFICPAGLAQELLHKLPTPKVRKSRVTRLLSWVKYGILLLFVIWIPLASVVQKIPVPAFCKYICPAGTLEGAVGLLSHPDNADLFPMLGGLFTLKLLIAVLLVTGCMFVYRLFCRFLCPLGALYSLFAKWALLGVQVEESACVGCGKCVAKCQMDIRHVGDRECIHCGGCIPECPTKAITWKGGKLFLQGSEVTPQKQSHFDWKRIVTWIAAASLLIGVLWAANLPERETVQNTNVQTVADDTPVGKEIGERCPDFTVSCYNGLSDFALADTRGKAVVINFWATWCGPCCKELPYFQALWETYGEDVAVVAVHSDLTTEDVQAWLDQTDYTLPFTLDADGSVIKALGGSTLLPMTVVLDRQGRIVYNQVGSVTMELLESIVKPLIAQ